VVGAEKAEPAYRGVIRAEQRRIGMNILK